MDASPPPLPDAPLRRWRLRSFLRWPHLRADPRVLLGLGICGLSWGVALAPTRQPLEGALRVNALSFGLQKPHDAASGKPLGFLVVRVSNLTIKGLGKGEPLVVPFRGLHLPLEGGSALSLIASSAAPLELRIALGPGMHVKNLQPEGKDQLVIDLQPPGPGSQSGAAAELTIIPPLLGPPTEANVPRGRGLLAVFQEPAKPPRLLPPPEAQFALHLAGGTRLRLQRSDANAPVAFERNLPVTDVRFTIERDSLFDQIPITISTLRSGTLHLGRMDPLSLRADQFLQIDPPGIGVLTSLRTEQNQLAVEVVGQSQRIRSGLSQKHPTTVLEGTLLSRHLSPIQISGFFGFLVGVISSLVLTYFKGV